MNAAQMLHGRMKKAIQQELAKPRPPKSRRALEAQMAEIMEYERANPWILAPEAR